MAVERKTFCYFGEVFTVKELCDLSGVSRKVFIERCRTLGFPYDITLVGELLANRWYRPRTEVILIEHDGYKEPLTIAQTVRVYGVSDGSIRDRIEKYGRTLTVQQLQVDKQRQAAGAKSKGKCSRVRFDSAPRRPAKSEAVASSVGCAERKYFPNAGQSGFCKAPIDNFSGTSSSGFPVYTGKQ